MPLDPITTRPLGMNQISRLVAKIEQRKKKAHEKAALAFVNEYMKANRLAALVESADAASSSTGIDHYDYVALHSIVRKKKPKFFLECGTGKSTWAIADALRLNHEQHGIMGKVISMESVEEWYQQALSILPPHLSPYVEIVCSPATTYQHAMVRGSVYEQVPDHPYEIVFVDGPAMAIEENGVINEAANMDFIRLLNSTDREVTAVIDYRVRTVMAYGLLLGKDRVKFLKPWNLGIVENATRKQLLRNDSGFPELLDRIRSTTSFSYDFPEWIE
jgi:predicted O-methyltransferase YrrM